MIWIYFIIFLCIGVEPTTQTLAYTEIGDGNAARSFRNLANDGTHFYWITITTAGGMDVIEADTLNAAGSAVANAHQDTPAGYSIDTSGTAGGFQSYTTPAFYPVIRAYGSDLYAAAMVYDAATGMKLLLAKRVSGTWTTSIITKNTVAEWEGGEIFKISTNFYVGTVYKTGGNYYTTIYKWDGTEYIDAASSRARFGQSDGTLFRFYVPLIGVRTFNGAVYATVADTLVTSASGIVGLSFFVWQNGFMTLSDYLADNTCTGFVHCKQGDSESISTDKVRPSFYYNSTSGQIETKFMLGTSFVYLYPFIGNVCSIPVNTNTNGGWDGSYDMCTGAFTLGKCYTIALNADATTDAIFTLPIMKPPFGEWHSQTKPVTNNLQAIYDDAGVLQLILRHSKPKFDGLLYNDTQMFSPAKSDLDKLVTKDYSDGTWDDHEIIDDLIATYCDFIQIGTIAAASAYTNKWNFVRRPLGLCLLDICLFNKRIWYLSGGYLLQYNAANIDSTINLALTDTDLGMQESMPLTNIKEKITVTGNLALSKIITNSLGSDIWQTAHPSIVDQTTLDTMATNIEAVTSAECTAVKVLRSNASLIDLGELFDLEYNTPPWDLADAPYINMNIEWRNIGNLQTYIGYSALQWAAWIQEALQSSQSVQAGVTNHANGTLTHAQIDAKLAGLTYVPLDENDSADWYAQYSTLTNTDSVELDFVNGGSANKAAGITETTAPSAVVPSTATALHISLQVDASTANANNAAQIYRLGNTAGRVNRIVAWCPAVAAYSNVTIGNVKLGAGGHIVLRFGVGAGTVTVRIVILGYYI